MDVSSVAEGRPGQTLALLLSKSEIPDTSRKPRRRMQVFASTKPRRLEGPYPGPQGMFLECLAQPETVISTHKGAPAQSQSGPHCLLLREEKD